MDSRSRCIVHMPFIDIPMKKKMQMILCSCKPPPPQQAPHANSELKSQLCKNQPKPQEYQRRLLIIPEYLIAMQKPQAAPPPCLST